MVKDFTTYLDNSFGLDNNLFDTWSQATSNNPERTTSRVAGSLTIDTLNQTSNASIGQGAQINQDTDPSLPHRDRRASSCWPPARTLR